MCDLFEADCAGLVLNDLSGEKLEGDHAREINGG